LLWLIIILGSLCLFLFWLLVSPVELEIDTVKAYAVFRWSGIGSAFVWYDNEWWFSMQLFFFHKTMPFSKIIKNRPNKVTATSKKTPQRSKAKGILKKITRVIGTLQITEWQLAIDSGRFDVNARLYPLNFLSSNSGHLFINFKGDNFLKVKIKGQPLKIVYALIK